MLALKWKRTDSGNWSGWNGRGMPVADVVTRRPVRWTVDGHTGEARSVSAAKAACEAYYESLSSQ